MVLTSLQGFIQRQQKTGDTIKIAYDMSCMHLFDKETEKLLQTNSL